jgi:hypothetical protein
MLTVSRKTFFIALLGMTSIIGCNAQSKSPVPPPTVDAQLAAKPGKAIAIFAGGCFWGTQAVFQRVKGVTTLNRQGNDVGTSYRSEIFYTTDEQRKIATAYIAQLNAAKAFPNRIVTQVGADSGFFDGEDYHQDYALHNPNNPYIMVCDRPKIDTLKAEFPNLFIEYKGSYKR